MNTFQLTLLPSELVTLVAKNLSLNSTKALALTCKKYYALLVPLFQPKKYQIQFVDYYLKLYKPSEILRQSITCSNLHFIKCFRTYICNKYDEFHWYMLLVSFRYDGLKNEVYMLTMLEVMEKDTIIAQEFKSYLYLFSDETLLKQTRSIVLNFMFDFEMIKRKVERDEDVITFIKSKEQYLSMDKIGYEMLLGYISGDLDIEKYDCKDPENLHRFNYIFQGIPIKHLNVLKQYFSVFHSDLTDIRYGSYDCFKYAYENNINVVSMTKIKKYDDETLRRIYKIVNKRVVSLDVIIRHLHNLLTGNLSKEDVYLILDNCEISKQKAHCNRCIILNLLQYKEAKEYILYACKLGLDLQSVTDPYTIYKLEQLDLLPKKIEAVHANIINLLKPYLSVSKILRFFSTDTFFEDIAEFMVYCGTNAVYLVKKVPDEVLLKCLEDPGLLFSSIMEEIAQRNIYLSESVLENINYVSETITAYRIYMKYDNDKEFKYLAELLTIREFFSIHYKIRSNRNNSDILVCHDAQLFKKYKHESKIIG